MSWSNWRRNSAPHRRPNGAVENTAAYPDAVEDSEWAVDAVEYAGGEERVLADAFRGAAGAPRIVAVRHGLDRALARWWSDTELPPMALLRDGLLLLEAGHSVGESQRTLLLRTALAYDRGVVTALAHQTDPERTALLMAGALLEPNPVGRAELSVERVQQLVWEDPAGEEWLPHLVAEIESLAVDDPTRLPLLEALRSITLVPAQPAAQVRTRLTPVTGHRGEGALPPAAEDDAIVPRHYVRLLLAVLAVLLVGGMLLSRQLQARAREAIEVPGQNYVLADVAGGGREVELAAYTIDRFEVTVQEYRRCFAAGSCPWPESAESTTHADYLANGAFAEHPMIRVDWEAAAAYCRWAGMRLPTAEEWQVAASYAPTTARYYRYPWGNTPATQLANSAATGQLDTQRVGLYHPFGSSPLGMADAAGNVAEWTATAAGPERYIVKGGSFLDQPADLTVAATLDVAAATSAAWLGFRCAASPG